MRLTRPLPCTHPELTIIEHPGYQEFRVENWRLARDGSGRIVRGTSIWEWWDVVVFLALSLIWEKLRGGFLAHLVIACTTLALARYRCSQVLHESVLIFPLRGIQLESHRGLPSLCTFYVTKDFVPLASLDNFIIYEGLRRWDIRYYLAAMKRSSSGSMTLHVAFRNILPYLPVLVEVYNRVQTKITSEPSRHETGKQLSDVGHPHLSDS